MQRNVFAWSAVALSIGLATGLLAPSIIAKAKTTVVRWDSEVSGRWPAGFQAGRTQDRDQPIYYRRAAANGPRPLVISLHTWSGEYDQSDELAEHVIRNDWNYVRPHAQGANKTPNACLSADVIADVEDAYRWAVNTMSVDESNVIVVGVSGGAYTALGALLQSSVPAKAYFAWVPITDLAAWRNQSMSRNPKYAGDVEQCAQVDGQYSPDEARRRSPLHMSITSQRQYPDLHLYAGIEDGFSGSVPTSHSILFYNRMARHYNTPDDNLVDAEQMAELTTLAHSLDGGELIGDRAVRFRRTAPGVSLTVFEGGHEMLPAYAAESIQRAITTRSHIESSIK